MKETNPRQILLEELSYHQLLILGATISALGFSAWYWTSLPTHGYTKFDTPAIFAAILGLCFVAVYEFTKLMAAKRGHSNKFFIAFMCFSILTGVGTHMNSEQGATEEKMNRSALFNRELKNIDEANGMIREYAYAASYDIDALTQQREAAVQKFLAQPALQANGKESGASVGAAISKGWKSYRHYNDQLSDLKQSYDSKINAKKKYESAKAAIDGSSQTASNTNATESAEASWLIQIIGQILTLFGVSSKLNAWSGFVLYLFATVILEMTVRFNGQQICEIRKKLYGFDPDDINSLDLGDAPAMQIPTVSAIAPTRVDTVQHGSPTRVDTVEDDTPDTVEDTQPEPQLPRLSAQDALWMALETIRNMVNSGALAFTRQHVISATGSEFRRLGKTHQMPTMDHEAAGLWIYNQIKQDTSMKATTPPPPATPARVAEPAIASAMQEPATASATDTAPAAAEQPRPIGFVWPKAELPHAPKTNGTGLHSPALGKCEEIFPLPLPETDRVADRVEDAQAPSPTRVANRVDTVQHGAANRVDTVQHGAADTVMPAAQHAEQTPNNDAQQLENAIAIIWKGIDNGAIQRISVRDGGQCQVALKGHGVGKSNPARRQLLAIVFDALGKEGVITRNPEYTGSDSGKPEWVINPSRTLKYA